MLLERGADAEGPASQAPPRGLGSERRRVRKLGGGFAAPPAEPIVTATRFPAGASEVSHGGGGVRRRDAAAWEGQGQTRPPTARARARGGGATAALRPGHHEHQADHLQVGQCSVRALRGRRATRDALPWALGGGFAPALPRGKLRPERIFAGSRSAVCGPAFRGSAGAAAGAGAPGGAWPCLLAEPWHEALAGADPRI